MKARADREALRFAAAEMFERGVDVGEIAWRLAVTRKSVNEWKRAWRSGGVEALASKGPGGARCRLDQVQRKILEQVLDDGPAARGWTEDQRWTQRPGRDADLRAVQGEGTRCAGCRICCTGWGGRPRCRSMSRPSGTRRRSPHGGGRPGRR